MRPATRTIATTLSFGLCAFAGTVLPAQGKTGPDLEQLLETLEEALGDRRAERDGEAIDVLEKLKGRAEDEKDKLEKDEIHDVARAVTRVFQVRPVRPHDDPRLYRAAAMVLGSLGEAGAAPLTWAYRNKEAFPPRKEWASLRATLLQELGNTKDPQQVEFLLDEACAAPLNELQAAAGRALANFEKAPAKIRREIAERLILRLASIHSEATRITVNRPGEAQDLSVTNAQVQLRAVGPHFQATLAKVTGVRFDAAPEWSRWWQKVGKKPAHWR